MRTLMLAAASALLAFGTPAASAEYIGDDAGGMIGTYVARYARLMQSGERVVLNGDCLSACTIILHIKDRIDVCATPNARFGFHAAWKRGDDGRAIHSPEGTDALMKLYPSDVKRWFGKRGLTPSMRYVSATKFVRPCAPEAVASATRLPQITVRPVDAYAYDHSD